MCLTERLLRFFLLQIRPGLPPPHAGPSMSLSGSSSGPSSGLKALQSPFSHAELYGIEHPTCGGLKLPAPGKHKTKTAKRKKSIRSVGSSGRSKTTVKGKNKKLSSTISSAPAKLPAAKNPPSTTHPSPFSLARVDADSPGTVRNKRTQALKGSHGNHRTTPHTPANSATRLADTTTHRYRQSPDKGRKEAEGTGHSLNGSTISTAISSLVAFSTMSTSDTILRMQAKTSNRESVLNAPPHRTGRTGREVPVPNLTLQSKSLHFPPHMQVHRRTLQAGSRSFGQRKEAWPLTVEEIVHGLGRLQYQHIIIMSGAGVSTSSGIPDFR